MRIALPSGGWADVRDTPLTWGERKQFIRLQRRNVAGDGDANLEMVDYTLGLYLLAWSHGGPPYTSESLEKAEARDVERVYAEANDVIFATFSFDTDVNPDPASPTDPSLALNGHSRAGETTQMPSTWSTQS